MTRTSGAAPRGTWVHPLLGWRLELAGREIIYETSWNEADYLREHRVAGALVLPATGYLELARRPGGTRASSYWMSVS